MGMVLIMLILAGLVLMSSIAYQMAIKAKYTHDCDATISEAQSSSIRDPLYEPPKRYFECIEAL